MDLALAVDVGGTKLAAGLVDSEGKLLYRAHFPTAGTDDPEALFVRLCRLIDSVGASSQRQAVVAGVGCGGPMTPGGEEVSPLNIAAWRNFPLKARLAEYTGLAVHVDNDAKALALGEGWVGAAKGESNFIAMVVSTGVGGGIVVDGRLLGGASGNAGHIGHVIVEPDGRTCGCGARGCLEAEASGPAIAAATGAGAAEAKPEVIARAGSLVGRAVASVVNLCDLRLALVGGSVALGFGEPFFTAAQAELDARACLAFSKGAVIGPVGLGDASPLVGAAAVGWRGEGHDVGVA
ncbi:MAG: ROK family protein [Acidimicrobiales bacterium]